MYRHLKNYELLAQLRLDPRNEALRDELVDRALKGLLYGSLEARNTP